MRGLPLTVLLATLLVTADAAEPLQPPQGAFVPKFEALAETRLLMEGLAQPNYTSVTKLLRKKPADAETWTFARGQALIIAETGNLLLLRPPRNQGRDTWMRLAMDMRKEAGALAQALGRQDLELCRTDLVRLTNACNTCHKTFRVAVQVGPGNAEPAPRGGGKDAE
jgi:hypothetical protein